MIYLTQHLLALFSMDERQKVLFLDRDGVINEDIGHFASIEKFKFRDGILEICKFANLKGFKIVILTNQSGIGRGFFTLEEYEKLSSWMLAEFYKNEVRIDLILTSPINPESENSAELWKRRKPNSGMFFDADEIIGINFLKSIMIGDNVSDLTAARSAGISKFIGIGEKTQNLNDIIWFEDVDSLNKRKAEIII